MAGDGSLMGAVVVPHAVNRRLPGWVTPLLQSIALVLILSGLAFANLSIYLCLPVALLLIWLPCLKRPARSPAPGPAAPVRRRPARRRRSHPGRPGPGAARRRR